MSQLVEKVELTLETNPKIKRLLAYVHSERSLYRVYTTNPKALTRDAESKLGWDWQRKEVNAYIPGEVTIYKSTRSFDQTVVSEGILQV